MLPRRVARKMKMQQFPILVGNVVLDFVCGDRLIAQMKARGCYGSGSTE
jgi:hypothetical protein